MSRPIIICDQVSKYYNLGIQRGRNSAGSPPSLREAVSDMLNAARDVFTGKRHEKPKVDRGFWALKDVSFEVGQGEVVGIVGSNGAGKSTLLKILSRIVEPTSGRARLRGRLASLLEVGTGFHAELSGRENIYLNGAILGMKKAEIDRKFDEIVAFSEIEQFLDTPVKYYSSGMYVRLAFAVAAHLEPEILIVDEVLAVGDFSFQKKCLGKMHDVAAGDGRTILFVSHNMGALSQLCNRGILLSNVSVKAIGSIQEVITRYLADAGQSSIQTNFPIDPHKPCQWISSEVLHEDDTPGSEFTCDEPIKIRVTLLMRQLVSDTLIDLSIFTVDGTRVLFTDFRDGDPTIVERLGVGLHIFELQIPARLLAPTTFTIGMAAYRRFSDAKGHQDGDIQPRCGEFSLRDVNNLWQHRPGVLGILIPWKHTHRESLAEFAVSAEPDPS
jgi:lipopolysaccharide transport system ATP-binding protein